MELAPEVLPTEEGTPECAETLPVGESNCTPEVQEDLPAEGLLPLSPEEKRALVQNALDQILGEKYIVSFFDQDRGLHTLSGRNLSDMELCYMADTINEHRRQG